MIRETFRELRVRVLTNISEAGTQRGECTATAKPPSVARPPLCFLLLFRVLRPTPAPRCSPCHRLGLGTRGMLVQIRSEGPGLW